MSNYRTDDHRCPNLVRVSLESNYVMISGNDDYALVKYYNSLEKAMIGFLDIISKQFVDIDDVIVNGFTTY